MPLAPVNDVVTIMELIDNPYPFYRQMRAESPVVSVSAVSPGAE